MSLYRTKQSIKARILETQKLIDMVGNHPIMSVGLVEKLNELHHQLDDLANVETEAKIQLLFSGNAVMGSQGIKSSFIAKTITPFQEMVKTQFAIVRFGSVGKRGQAKNASNTELYLTSLPTGSFGVELSQLASTDLFAATDVSSAIKQVITLVANTSSNDELFESTIENTPKRNLINLKKFLYEIANENSILKMESGEVGIEISPDDIKEAYNRVSSTVDEEEEVLITGVFRGLLLDSGRFEFQDTDGIKHSGFISEDISEEQLVDYNSYLNIECKIHLRIHKTAFKTGNERTDYELLEIMSLTSS
ncbi:MAG: hypothetical protein AAGB30_10785 [Pedobacter sp.]